MRIINRTAIFTALCLAAMPLAPAYAVDWVLVDANDNNTVWYYDADTLRRSGDEVTVWGKYDHSRDKTVKAKYTISLNRYNCTQRTTVLISWTQYYRNGKIDASSLKPYEQEEEQIPPNTMFEAMLEAVCK